MLFCQFAFLSICLLSTCRLVNLPFCQLAILSMCYVVNLPFCQLAIWSCHLVLPFSTLAILSTCHLVNLPFCQFAFLSICLLSTCYFVNYLFRQLGILSIIQSPNLAYILHLNKLAYLTSFRVGILPLDKTACRPNDLAPFFYFQDVSPDQNEDIRSRFFRLHWLGP